MTVALEQRRRLRAPNEERPTLELDISTALFELHRESTALSWPSGHYRKDPVRFHREILGIDPWGKQVEILESVRDNPLTSVASGHKVGKSTIGAGAGLWFYSSFDDARVIMTAPVARQVQDTLWRATKMLFDRAGRCLSCKVDDPQGPRPCPHSATLDGEFADRASTGLVSENYREIRGYTARDAEKIQGTSGHNMLFVLDEASGIASAIFEAIEGNRGAWDPDDPSVNIRLLMIGNPTKTSGEFYDSHNHPKKKLLYKSFQVSSRETPNAVQGRVVIKGLATRAWIEQMEAKYGPESAFVKVRVDGEFPIGEDGKAFSLDTITRSQERWDEMLADGPLSIGIDPAGESGTGDDASFAVCRGLKHLAQRDELGLDEDAHGTVLLELIEEHRSHPRERAIVNMDAEGPIGAKVYKRLARLAHRTRAFEVHRVRSSERARRYRATCDRVRDELAWSLHLWFRAGGAILENEQLEQELHELEWDRSRGKSKITPKKEIRKVLGRSPDRYDALALAVWEPSSATAKRDRDDEDDEDGLDVDDIDDVDERTGQIDPYGGR
jgi:phage terminase large subunit